MRNSATFALGAPSRKQPSLTLGCGGTLVVRFTDNALIDVAGDDLYIYEVGPNVEATKVDISVDGRHWLNVGKVAGATASLDIQPYAKPRQSYSYVRLTDLKGSCQSSTPGADIDAIAAIGSVIRHQFSAAILFDFDQATLKRSAKKILLAWLKKLTINSGYLQINGHTDLSGSSSYNLALSLKRAQAVADFLQSKAQQKLHIEVIGLGESQPLVNTNTTEAGIKNRRVEILHFAK
ncbi:MAG: OmpA family protein [Mariprofundaceae bacterium]